MHVGRISILSLQSSHIFFKMFKMRKYWVPIEANRILWQKLAKKGEMSPITLSLPLKARKRPLPDGFLSTMKVEVSNKYSKVYCCCCHLCSQKKPQNQRKWGSKPKRDIIGNRNMNMKQRPFWNGVWWRSHENFCLFFFPPPTWEVAEHVPPIDTLCKAKWTSLLHSISLKTSSCPKRPDGF